MKIADQARWLAQQAEIGASTTPEIGKEFIAFVEEWCETAEDAMGYRTVSPAPLEALRAALEPTECRRGNISGNWLAQMLLVICGNWAYGGDELFEVMTPFEQRLVGDMAAVMNLKLQGQAEGRCLVCGHPMEEEEASDGSRSSRVDAV